MFLLIHEKRMSLPRLSSLVSEAVASDVMVLQIPHPYPCHHLDLDLVGLLYQAKRCTHG